jgi:hypothetical protein
MQHHHRHGRSRSRSPGGDGGRDRWVATHEEQGLVEATTGSSSRVSESQVSCRAQLSQYYIT